MYDKDTNPYVARIKNFVLDFMKNEPAKIYLFGSWAKGTAHRGSDVDIAIDADETQNPSKISELRELLEESTIPYSVDVVDMRFASESIIDEIKKYGVVWKNG
ncbi:MAG: nucleotidyltransferase domain-containing protein [Selenomonadaceae bacterium]|nr:nucleotidyltransferase domain-containing protein [Selenomonadaceae bacterium]